MSKEDQKKIEEQVERLIKARGWEKFHTPAQLVPALIVECSELMNYCLWQDPEEINEKFREGNEDIIKELADIAINYYSIIRYCGIDVEAIVTSKVDELLNRYSYLKPGEHR